MLALQNELPDSEPSASRVGVELAITLEGCISCAVHGSASHDFLSLPAKPPNIDRHYDRHRDDG